MISKFLDFLEASVNYPKNPDIGQTLSFLSDKYGKYAKLCTNKKSGQRGHVGELMTIGKTHDNSKDPDIKEEKSEIKTCVFELNVNNLTVKEDVKINALNNNHVPHEFFDYSHALDKISNVGYHSWLRHPDSTQKNSISIYLGIITHSIQNELDQICREWKLLAEYINEKVDYGISHNIRPMSLFSWGECKKIKFNNSRTYLKLKPCGEGGDEPDIYGLYFTTHFVRSVLLPNSYIKKNESFAKFLVDYYRYHNFEV